MSSKCVAKVLNQVGVTLVEVLVVIGITAIISLFAFDSVRQVIVASMGVQKKADFDSLTNDVRYLTDRLDQCTCNFQALTIPTTPGATMSIPNQALVRFSLPQAPCGGAATIIAQVAAARADGQLITAIGLSRIQYLKAMGVALARLVLISHVQQQTGQNAKDITRQFPIMFSVDNTKATGSSVPIIGCIGMTGTPMQ